MKQKMKILSVRIEHAADESMGTNADYIGIIAKAMVWNPKTQVTQTIRSGGLWAVDTNSPREYLGELALEQMEGLRAELLALGLGARAIVYAFARMEVGGSK